MDRAKRERLTAAGWQTGDAADFLELTEEESVFVELKLALAAYLRELRARNSCTQSQVARRLGLRIPTFPATQSDAKRPPRGVLGSRCRLPLKSGRFGEHETGSVGRAGVPNLARSSRPLL